MLVPWGQRVEIDPATALGFRQGPQGHRRGNWRDGWCRFRVWPPGAAGDVLGAALHPWPERKANRTAPTVALNPPAGSATETLGRGRAPSVATGAEISIPAPSPYLRVTSWYPVLVRRGWGGGRTDSAPARYQLSVV